jgi:hypothetical protein
MARAVPAILASPAFLRLWRTALAATHHQLMLVLRDRSQLLTITGSALTVDVPVAVGMLIKAVGLPHQLERLLPTAIPVSATILDNPAMGQARTAVHLTDILSRILPAAALALALAGLAAARRRRRALLWFLIPVAALGILGALAVHLLSRTGGSPFVTGATGALTAPLTGQLILTSAICAAAGALLLVAPASCRIPIQMRARRSPAKNGIGAADDGSQPRRPRHRPDGNRISRHRRPAAGQRATAGQWLADPVAAAARRPNRPRGHRAGR